MEVRICLPVVLQRFIFSFRVWCSCRGSREYTQMAKLWHVRVQDGNGKELYGEDYADIWAINRLHYKAASPLVCDHVRVYVFDWAESVQRE